jgi:type I restriction enzyme S subunit
MNQDLVLEHLNRISDAPDAVPRLRRFVLDLAVRGKLVQQDRSDEPASDLLKRIQAEKVLLLRASKQRKATQSLGLEEHEAPFRAPMGWKWTRVRQITSDRGQTLPSKDFTYIDVTSINKETGCIADAKVLAASGAPSRARKLVQTGDVLYSCVRPYLLNIAVVEADIIPAPIASTAFAVLNGFGLIISRYMWIVLRSPFMVECVESKMRGQAYPAINDSDFAELPFPLPPLAEQHRIVAKVDELMALCDRLEDAQRERESRRDRLTAATHHHLNNGADAEALRSHAQFFIGHLPRLTARPDQIKQLRQTILNLAVRGMLTPQNHDFIPVQYMKGRDFPNPEIRLPKDWSIKPLTSVSSSIVDCPHSTPQWTANGKICVRTIQFRPGRLDLMDVRFVSEATFLKRIQRLEPQENDILYSREGGILGVACRVPPGIQLCLGQRMMLIRSSRSVASEFLELVLNSPLISRIAKEKTTGGAAPRINVATAKAYPIPLPPLAEQHRIVAKVDDLMALCDQPESQLTSARTEASRLLESVLHHALQASA